MPLLASCKKLEMFNERFLKKYPKPEILTLNTPKSPA